MAGEKTLGEVPVQQIQQKLKKEAQPIHYLCEQTINKIDDTLDTQSFQNILKKFQLIFETSNTISQADLQKLEELFEDIKFLQFFTQEVNSEIVSIYGNGNTDAFHRLAFLGFMFVKGNPSKSDVFLNIHSIESKKIENMLTDVTNQLNKLAVQGCDIPLFQMNLLLYVGLLDIITIIAIFNEIDSKKQNDILALRDLIEKSVLGIFENSHIPKDIVLNNVTLKDHLTYIQARTKVNYAHIKSGDKIGFSKRLEDIFGGLQQLQDVKFIGRRESEFSLTLVTLDNASRMMIEAIEEHKNKFCDTKDAFFNPDFYNNVWKKYTSEVSNIFREFGIVNTVFLENNVTNFDEAKQYCLGMIYLVYLRLSNRENQSFDINKATHIDIKKMLDDMGLIFQSKDIKKEQKIDFQMEYCITLLKNSEVDEATCKKLCIVLLEHEKFGNYYNESIKIELIHVLLGKIIEKKSPTHELLKKVQEYLTKNKKSSILLSKYAALYKVLSLGYSMIKETEGAMEMFFIYGELTLSHEGDEETYDKIFGNIFGKTYAEAKKDTAFNKYYQTFLELQMTRVQGDMNSSESGLILNNIEKGLASISEGFLYGIAQISVIQTKVEKEKHLRKGYDRQYIDIDIPDLHDKESSDENIVMFPHKIFFDFPKNYAGNMERILSESKKEYIRTKIITLYQKLRMVVNDVDVVLKNKIIESIHSGGIKLWGQEIKTIYQEDTMELLCRIIDKDTGKELDEIGPNKVKVPIFKQLKIAERLGYRSIITNFNIQSAFLISQKYPTKKLSLNMSYDDILDEAVIECFLKLGEQYPDAKRNITIELLENEIIDKRRYITKLRKLVDMGYKLAVDDFGSEYNNFSILTLLVENDIPIAKIKIDRVVIQKLQDLEGMENDPDYGKKLKLHKGAITTIKSVLEIAQDYDIPHVVAEYVEYKFIYDLLLALGVHEFQGHYFDIAKKIEY